MKSNLSRKDLTCGDDAEMRVSNDHHAAGDGAHEVGAHTQNLAEPAAEKEPGEAQSATPDPQTHLGQGAVLSGHSDSPTTCDWCGRSTALLAGCQNERCASR